MNPAYIRKCPTIYISRRTNRDVDTRLQTLMNEPVFNEEFEIIRAFTYAAAEQYARCNIHCLRPNEKVARESISSMHLLFKQNQHFSTVPTLLSFFENLRPDESSESNDRVIYKLPAAYLNNLIIDLNVDHEDDPERINLIAQRSVKIVNALKTLKDIAKQKGVVKLWHIDQSITDWFTNPTIYLSADTSIYKDPTPWTVDFDGLEFTFTRTRSIASDKLIGDINVILEKLDERLESESD